MRKVIAFLLSAIMCATVIGCANTDKESGANVTQPSPTPTVTAQSDNIMEVAEKVRAYYSECIETIRANQGKVEITTADIANALDGFLKECTEPTSDKSETALKELEREYKSCKNHVILSNKEKESDYIYDILIMSHNAFAALTRNPKRY